MMGLEQAFIAKIYAKHGKQLCGGVVEIKSSPFETREQAEDWIDQIKLREPNPAAIGSSQIYVHHVLEMRIIRANTTGHPYDNRKLSRDTTECGKMAGYAATASVRYGAKRAK